MGVTPLKEFLLPENSAILKRNLLHLTANKTKKNDPGQGDGSKDKFQNFCESHGLRVGELAYLASHCKSKWTDALPDRERKVLMANVAVDKSITSLDSSQTIDRCFIGHNALLSTIVPQGRIVLLPPIVNEARVMAGIERLHVQGFPLQLLMRLSASDEECMTDTLFCDLVGNAFCGPVYAAILIVFY